MKLIVGLGNPGEKYINTRHNVGFEVINHFVDYKGISLNKEKFGGQFYKDNDFIIAQPLTFMNLSGDFVQTICKFFKIEPSDVLIIYDDMDYQIGHIAMKPLGSANGHKGLKDIMIKLKTQNISRIKIGIGRQNKAIDHVLGYFSKQEKKIIDNLIPKIIKGIQLFLKNDLNKAMKKINTK